MTIGKRKEEISTQKKMRLLRPFYSRKRSHSPQNCLSRRIIRGGSEEHHMMANIFERMGERKRKGGK